MKLLSLNIEGDHHFDRIFPFVSQELPDVMCFNEVFEADVAMIKHATQMDGTFSPAQQVLVPNHFNIPPRGVMGALVLSHLPIKQVTTDCYFGDPSVLPQLTDANGDAANRVLTWLEVEAEDGLYRFVTTHFTVTKNAEVTSLQRENLERMLGFLSKKDEFVLCGDFNTPRGKELFDTLAKRYKDNIPADVLTTLDPTLHRVGSALPSLVVDGLFTTPGYAANDVRVVSGLSDHCGILAHISLKG